jgi:ribosomal protein L29
MKSRELSKLRTEDVASLEKMLTEKKTELGLNYADTKAGKEKNLRKSKMLRRDIAQIMTVIRELEIVDENKQKEDKPEVKK